LIGRDKLHPTGCMTVGLFPYWIYWVIHKVPVS